MATPSPRGEGRGEGGRQTFFNATGLAEIRLGALESDLSRRNQMQADEGGRRREKLENLFASPRARPRLNRVRRPA